MGLGRPHGAQPGAPSWVVAPQVCEGLYACSQVPGDPWRVLGSSISFLSYGGTWALHAAGKSAKGLLVSCVPPQKLQKAQGCVAEPRKPSTGFPACGRSRTGWGKHVCVCTDTRVCADSEVQLRAWLSLCDLFSPFLKYWHLPRWMLDIVT